MSTDGFTQHSCRGALLFEKQMPAHYYGGTLRVFDIGDERCFGAWYPDNARIAVPKDWFPEAQRAYERLKAEGALFDPTNDGLPPDYGLAPERGKHVDVAEPPPPRSAVPRATSAADPAPVARPPLRQRRVT